MSITKAALLSLALALPIATVAQGFEVAFGSLQQDTKQPVEVDADSLEVNQQDGSAVFSGNVLIVQGTMRLTAPLVHVFYNESTSGISRLEATGGVVLVKDQDAAEADRADYDIEAKNIIMTGDVLLTQGNNTLQSQKMTVDLRDGTAQMDGRVKTILRSGDN